MNNEQDTKSQVDEDDDDAFFDDERPRKPKGKKILKFRKGKAVRNSDVAE